jgi:hypothetical protein
MLVATMSLPICARIGPLECIRPSFLTPPIERNLIGLRLSNVT